MAAKGHRRGSTSKPAAQLGLDFRPTGHGGPRPGAGRPRLPPGHRRRPTHARRPAHRRHEPVHVTLRLCADVGRLRRAAAYTAIRLAVAVCAGRRDFRIVELSIQHHHLHLMVEADDKRALANGLRAFMISAAQRLNQTVGRKGVVFERYHLSALRTPRQVRAALCYVLNNWRRHREHLGLAERRFTIDPYSSGPGFGGWRRVPRELGLSATYRPLPVVGARTWLLTSGWRMHHPPIDPEEVPGPSG